MVQIVKQTWEERYNEYMSLPKEELAKMLAELDKFTLPAKCAECNITGGTISTNFPDSFSTVTAEAPGFYS